MGALFLGTCDQLFFFGHFCWFQHLFGHFRLFSDFLAVFWGARSSSYGKISATPPPHLRSPLLASLWLRPTPPPPYKTRFCVMLSSRLVLDLLGGSEKLEILNPPPRVCREIQDVTILSKNGKTVQPRSNRFKRGQRWSTKAKRGQNREKGWPKVTKKADFQIFREILRNWIFSRSQG